METHISPDGSDRLNSDFNHFGSGGTESGHGSSSARTADIEAVPV